MATFKIYVPTETETYFDASIGQNVTVINSYAEVQIEAPTAEFSREPIFRAALATQNGEISEPDPNNLPEGVSWIEALESLTKAFDFFAVYPDSEDVFGIQDAGIGLIVPSEYGTVDFGGQVLTFASIEVSGLSGIAYNGMVFIGAPPPIGVPYAEQGVTSNSLDPDTVDWFDGAGVLTIPEDAVFPALDLTPYFLAPCFTRGTYIRTPAGARPIEDLRAGDLVETADHGLQPIRWIGSRVLPGEILATAPKLRPIRIAAGALGHNLPAQDLRVSPQHRMLVRSKIAERMFGGEVLVPAVKLTALPGVFVDDATDSVEYFHILFDQHEIVFANGAESESLHTGPIALASLPAAARAEIFAVFPELERVGAQREMARAVPTGRATKSLLARHAANGQAIQATI